VSFLRADLAHPPAKEQLEITVFGPGFGESVVLHVPGIGWGVIDCCELTIEGRHVVPPLDYLTNLLCAPYPKLAFVILTHPHKDHYSGMDDLLTKYPGGTERVCLYTGRGTRELRMYLIQQRIGYRYDLPGLLNVFTAIDNAVRKGASARKLSEMTTVVERRDVSIAGIGSVDVSLMALSPSAQSADRYVDKLFEAFPKTGQPLKPVSDPDIHNLISVALVLKAGRVQVILGSDLETGARDGATGWRAVVSNRDCPNLHANFVKVAHHGSVTGFSEEAWERHCAAGKPLAVVTPFVTGSVILPRSVDVERIGKIANRVGITSTIQVTDNLNKFYSREIVQSIKHRTRSMKVVKPQEEIGFLRSRFLLDGTIVENVAQSPARWLSPETPA